MCRLYGGLASPPYIRLCYRLGEHSVGKRRYFAGPRPMRNAHFDRTQDHRCHSEPLPPIPLTAQEQATLGILRDFPRSTGTIR
ncbi:MAG: hypothetical protein GTN65_08875, partial [Armatimonadetes bacterium]|nr:hypothetical protein [Armatimonadota bacterium]NIO97195.1 hypothetical protein [Armatimonadota bacterium]